MAQELFSNTEWEDYMDEGFAEGILDTLEAAFDAHAADEREACAQVAEEHQHRTCGEIIAAEIRGRGKQP